MAPPSTLRTVLNTLQIRNDYEYVPAGLKWRSNTFFITATVAVGLFTEIFLYGLIVPVLPFMLKDRVGIADEQIQSYVSGLLATYAAASVVASPFTGLLADNMSTRQAPFLIGLAVLLASTLMLFLGSTLGVLIFARILQGISASFVWTVGLALCLETVGPQNLGKTIGTIFSFISVGSLCAPALGGILYEKAGYLSVCALALSVIAVDLIMRILVIEKKVAKRYQANIPSPTDNIGDAENQNESTEEGTDANEQDPLLGKKDNQDDEEDFRLPSNLTGLSKKLPILPCLKNPRLLTALYLAVVQAIFLGSLDATVPLVAKDLFNFNSLKAGLLFLPQGVVDLIFGPLIGWCVDHYGTKPVAVLSYIYLTPATVLLRLPHEGGLDQILLYSGILLVCAVGLAGIGAPSIVEAGAVMERYHKANPEHFGQVGPYAQLYGLINMAFSFGLTIGPELAGELKRVIGYGNMNAVLAGICAITAVLSFLYIGPKPKKYVKQVRENGISE